MIPTRTADPHSRAQNVRSGCPACSWWVFSCACLCVLFSSVSPCDYPPLHWYLGAAGIQHPMVCTMSWQWGWLCGMAALEAASQVSVQTWYWQRLSRRQCHHQHGQLGPCGCKHLGSGAEQLCGAYVCPPCQSDCGCSCHTVSLLSAQWAMSTLLMLGSIPRRQMQPMALGGSMACSRTALTRCVGQGS